MLINEKFVRNIALVFRDLCHFAWLYWTKGKIAGRVSCHQYSSYMEGAPQCNQKAFETHSAKI